MRLRELIIAEDGEGGGAATTSTTSSDIASVSFPLLVRGKTRKEKRKNARAAVGLGPDNAPNYIGQGVYENEAKVGQQAMNYKRSNRYPDGKEIPESLPPRYQPASFPGVPENQKCSNCLYYESKTQKCSKFAGSPVVRPAYWCLKWESVEVTLKEFSTAGGNSGEDPLDNYPCYDCGSTIFLHHTELCELAEDNAIRDLPAKPGSQHWTGEIPKGLHTIPGLQEAHVVDSNNVIYRLDREKPMSDTEVLVLGGAGRYTLQGLRDKARREADALAQDLKVEHGGSFRRAVMNIKQLENTINTIVAAYNELGRIRRKGGRGSRGITDEDKNFVSECLTSLEQYTAHISRALNIAERLQDHLIAEGMQKDHVNAINGMYHLGVDPGYGFYRWSVHVAGNCGGGDPGLGANAGPFAYAYTDAEDEMIKKAVKAMGGKIKELTPRGSTEHPEVNKKSTMPTIDWKKIK
jgi:hypothetical protein